MRAKIGLMCMLLILLSGCAQPVSLAERAIVKAIYIDKTETEYTVSLAFFTCEPSTDVGSVTGEARVCTGKGPSIDAAMLEAQSKQNKKPFFAHNWLLLLGPGTQKSDLSETLQQFARSENARQRIGAFLVDFSAKKFEKSKDDLPSIVREAERIVGNREQQYAQNILTLHTPQSGLFLPVLRVDTDPDVSVSVDSFLVLRADKTMQEVKDNELQLALVLAEKAKSMTLAFSKDGVQYVVKTQNLFLQKETAGTAQQLHLALTLCGKVESAAADGRALYEDELDTAVRDANEVLRQAFDSLAQKTFFAQSDVFDFTWYLRQQDQQAVKTLLAKNRFFETGRLSFQSALRRK